MPLFRRRPVPDAVRSVRLPDGDRRLSWALTATGEPVVATGLGLVLPGRDRLDWVEVERAAWERPVLVVHEVAPVEGTGRVTRLRLADDPGDLPDVVRSQVTSSVAWSTHLRLQPSGGVRLVGRRRPGEDLLRWQMVFDAGTDADDPQLRAQAEQAVLEARRAIG